MPQRTEVGAARFGSTSTRGLLSHGAYRELRPRIPPRPPPTLTTLYYPLRRPVLGLSYRRLA